MKVLIDTNILLDVLAIREPFYKTSKDVINICLHLIEGCISPHSILDVAYILKSSYGFSLEDIYNTIHKLYDSFEIAEENDRTIIRALQNTDFTDIEDSVQNECASSLNADCIITRNKKDFASSDLPVLAPEEFINLFY